MTFDRVPRVDPNQADDADGLRLLAVNDILELDSREVFHFAVGYSRGSPWRVDSVYLPQTSFELIDPPIRALDNFIPQGVTVVRAESMDALLGEFRLFRSRLEAAREPALVYGDRAVFKPALARWDTWNDAKCAVSALVRELDDWLRAQATAGVGITIYSPGR